MDIVNLPLYSSLERIDVAISGMKSAGRAGIVIQDDDKFRVATAGMILSGRPSGVAALADLSTRSMLGVHYLTGLDITRFGLDSVRPLLVSQNQFFDLFTSIDEDFVIVSAASNSATIVARSDTYARELSVPADYYCTGPRQHGYGERNRPENHRCSKCGALIVGYP